MARIVMDQAGMYALFEDPNGPLGKDLERRLINVEAAAAARCPVQTGRLRASITRSPVERSPRGFTGRVGTPVHYALHVELGTGIFGPRGRPITPVTKKALYWPGADHPVASVKGSEPQPFLRPAIDAARL